jgi:hypothetical protein
VWRAWERLREPVSSTTSMSPPTQPRMTHIPPDRISLAEIVRTIKPLMSKSTFYGTRKNRGPRWTEIERLDLRGGPYGVTGERQRFERWYREIQGALASTPHAIAVRLGDHAKRIPSDTTYGEQLAALCSALELGVITKRQFDYALATLPPAA